MLKTRKLNCLITCILPFSMVFGQKNIVNFPVKKLGNTIYEGVFTGNGLLGSMTYLETHKSIRVDVGRTDVFDHRKNKQSALFDKARLTIGHLALQFADSIETASGEINYAEAEALAHISTKSGSIKVKTLTFAERNLIYLEVSGKGLISGYKITWVPEEAKSSRMMFSHAQPPTVYPPNPSGSSLLKNDVKVYNQPLLAGGGYATAYKKIKAEDKDVYLISIGYETVSNNYIKEAVNNITSLSVKNLNSEIII